MAYTTKYASHGSIVKVMRFDEDHVNDTLQPAVYNLNFNQMAGYYLEIRAERLAVPGKIYGECLSKSDKVMARYAHATKSFGVLFSGDKGSGKTMLSSLISNRCIEELKLPVIMVEQSFNADSFSEFIQQLGECVIFIDEFGKKFDQKEDQGNLLGLFDGNGSGQRRLILLTENKTNLINSYMLNRPGRIHYHFRHDKLDEQTIREYCVDMGVPDDIIKQICIRQESSIEFSFDVLKAIVDEYKIFGGNVSDICEHMNIESPVDINVNFLEVISVYDASNKKERKLNEDCDGIFPFPVRDNHSYLKIERDGDPDNCDFLRLGIKDIVSKEGDVYTFAFRANNENIIVKARQKKSDAEWYRSA